VSLVLVLTMSIVVHKSFPYPLDFIVLTLNQVCGFKFQVFTGSPIHPPLGVLSHDQGASIGTYSPILHQETPSDPGETTSKDG
jgi:hypothetical protein